MVGALRPSYRQLLVLAFLLVCALLAASALQGLFTLERLLLQSRGAADSALRLATATERLDEQVLAMERAARQYLVLGDPALRRSFERGAQESAQQVALLADVVDRRLARDWRRQTDGIAAQLDLGVLERQLVDDFRVLNSLQATMAEQVRRHTEARNAALQAELEDGRRTLAQQVAAAAALALALALGFAWWLARPLQRVEAAILGLGENRLDDRV
jgi:two-component system, NtrC family, sensor histidine kinase GlrK